VAPPLAYMCSVHSNPKNYKIVKISRIKLNRAAALTEWRQLLSVLDLGCGSNLMGVLISLTAPVLRLSLVAAGRQRALCVGLCNKF